MHNAFIYYFLQNLGNTLRTKIAQYDFNAKYVKNAEQYTFENIQDRIGENA